MLHNLTASEDRQVYMTWEIDWVPETAPERTDIQPSTVRWLDVAGFPQIYPVFDAERGFDADGDGKFVFPDDVPSDPSAPGYEEREKISNNSTWTLSQDRTLLFAAGHLHPGGLSVDLEVARDGPDAGDVDGDDPSEVRKLFRSDAKYYEPAGAVSWDVSMTATRRSWRIALKQGDTVSIDVTYDVDRASWYESMGIMPLSITSAADPAARDPFEDAAAVQAMYDEGGILTHGRLPENIDAKAGKNRDLPDPRKLRSKGRRVPADGITIDSFVYSKGGYSATRDFPTRPDAPAGDQARRDGQLHQPRRAADDVAERAGLAQHHLLSGALQPRRRDRLSARPREDQVRLRPARFRDLRQPRGDHRIERVHDPATDQAGQDLYLLLPHSPVHAWLDPGQGRQAEEAVAVPGSKPAARGGGPLSPPASRAGRRAGSCPAPAPPPRRPRSRSARRPGA